MLNLKSLNTSNLRVLKPSELQAVSGGTDDPIIVVEAAPLDNWFINSQIEQFEIMQIDLINDALNEGQPDAPTDDGLGDDCENHDDPEPQTSDEKADRFARDLSADILLVSPPGTMGPPFHDPQNPNWTNAEALAFIGPDGVIDNELLWILGNSGSTTVPTDEVLGIFHSHPAYVYQHASGEYRALSSAEQALVRYPSEADWDSLQKVADNNGPSGEQNPSLYLMGPDGIVREFKLSDRDEVENLTDQQKAEGVGLEERELDSASECPSQ